LEHSQRPHAAAGGVERVLALLRHLAEHPRGITLTRLSQDFDAPKSSVHRALAALCRAGFARQDGDARYHLGLEFVRLAYRHQEAREDYRLVEPALRVLAERFGETTHYATLQDFEVVYLAKVTPRGVGIQMTSSVGGRNPAYCTGVGKALLMYALPDRMAVKDYVDGNGPLAARTPRTLTSISALHRSLEEGRSRGYTLDDEESERGITCVAFPVFLDSTREPSGAISISALAQRKPVAELQRMAEDARHLIEDVLGPHTTRPHP
jgi:IclR family transcriptional regulator, acetate operon repressor